MTTNITKLANGLRVVTHEMPHLETVSLGAWVGVGARDDPAPVNGIAHFLEHMAFKGTQKRSAKDIAEEIENIGGDINAATSIETTAYYARVLKGDEPTAIDVLSDIMHHSVFDAEELERERDVILQEIAASQDSPDDVVYDLAQAAAYSGQPLGRTILGTPETVEAISPDSLRLHLQQRYVAPKIVLSAAGGVSHDEIVQLAEDKFGGLPLAPADGASDSHVETEPAHYAGGPIGSSRPFEQCHVLVGFEGPQYNSQEYFTAQVLSGLLGGGMSSRLFQEAREKRGMCYSVYSTAWALRDTGFFAVHAATSPELAVQLLDVISSEIHRLSENDPSEQEIQRSKAQLKAGLMMGLESSAVRAEQMARQLAGHGKLTDKTQLIEKVEQVGADDIRALLQKMIKVGATVAVVGSGAKSIDIAERSVEGLRTAAA
ncbi:MAG: pitrilysin family protein [Filomicrobium sp.]